MPEKPRWISHIGIGSLTVAVSISSVALAEEIPRELRSRLASAVERLGHERFSVRETARKLLVASGENALPVVVGAAADHGDIEVRYAARWIVGRIIQNVGVSRTTGLKTLLIGPDAFQMGSPANESERHDDELLHRV